MDGSCSIDRVIAAGTSSQPAAARPQESCAKAAPSFGLLSELGWTLLAVLLTLAVGGMILVAISLSGGVWWIDDFQVQWLPGYLDMNRALREGSFPLLSTTSWYGGDFSGEYQYGVFSVAHLLIILFVFQLKLGLAGTAAALIAVYEAILASGVFRLARRLGLTPPNAMIATLAATLNGYMFFWGAQTWCPALASFAWLPWTWWGMQLALDSRHGCWRFVPAGLFVYLLVTAGWPFTVLSAGVVTIWLLARNRDLFRDGRIWPLPVAWLLGLALASPAILSLLEYHSFTKRSATWTNVSADYTVPVSAFGGTFVPSMPSHWNTFFADFEKDIGPSGLRHSSELFCGLVPSVALLAVLIRRRTHFIRKYRWELGLWGLAALLCYCGAAGAFRWAFRWLPLYHLSAGLLGGFALQAWSSADEPSAVAQRHKLWFARPESWLCLIIGLAVIGVCTESLQPVRAIAFFVSAALLILSFAWFRGDSRVPQRIRASVADLAEYPGFWSCLFVCGILGYVYSVLSPFVTTHFVVTGLLLLGLSFVWLLGNLLLPVESRGTRWLAVAIMVPALVLGSFRPGLSVPHWSFSETILQAGPLDKERTYYASLTRDDVFARVDRSGEINRFGNTTMYAGLSFVNGYSAMQPAQLTKVFDLIGMWQNRTSGERFLTNYIAPGGLLTQMGVDGFVLGRGFAKYTDLVLRSGWDLVARFPQAIVFHRPGPPSPRVRSLSEIILPNPEGPSVVLSPFGLATIGSVDESRLSTRCRVENTSRTLDAVIAFSRAYYPGYRAYLNGVEIPVEAIGGMQAGVRIAPKAAGELLLVFLPKSVIWGVAIAAVASLATILFLAINAIVHLRHSATHSTFARTANRADEGRL